MILDEWKLPEKMGFVKRDRVLGSGLWAMAGLTAVILIAVLIVFNRVPPQVPFFYTRPWGKAQIVNKQDLLIFAGGILTTGLAGLLVSLGLYKRDQILSRLVIWCLVPGLFLALLSVVTIWLRVGH